MLPALPALAKWN